LISKIGQTPAVVSFIQPQVKTFARGSDLWVYFSFKNKIRSLLLVYCNIGNQHSILGVTGQVRQSVRGNVGSNFANLIGTCRKYDDRPQFLKVIIGVGELTKV
jgi:hypothetical protein